MAYFLININRHTLLLLVLLFIIRIGLSQTSLKPIAKFSFNDGLDIDEVNKNKVKLVGTNFTEDRFGNSTNAIFLSGHAASYINLGNYTALKPKSGSISLWFKIENPVMAGSGLLVNPIIITKCDSLDSFYEAYCIYFEPLENKIAASITKDSIKQINHYSESFKLNKWHHLVLAYDHNNSFLYFDGKLQSKYPKGFDTKFLKEDSVIVGSTGNKKNERFLKGDIDDIEFYDRVLSEKEVNELFNAPDPNTNKIILYWAIFAFALLLLVIITYFFIRQQITKGIKKAREGFELQNKLLETELRVNRASMNPHFLFNSLNTLHNFILEKKIEGASDYLLKFSKLLRKILDTNMHESLSLELEIELLELYLELEKMRFEENISYKINIDKAIFPSSIHIPIMMLQPFIENAIWHGLLNKEGEKKINISFSVLEKKYVHCIIEDNGNGRKPKEPALLEKKSLAISFISQRLELLNKLHHLKCSLHIEDKPDQQGTIIKITLPILNK